MLGSVSEAVIDRAPCPVLVARTNRLGRTVIADEGYLRDSILLRHKDVVAGFEPLMPSFQGQLSEEEILDLIAYLKSEPRQ